LPSNKQTLETLLQAYLADKALYELGYELNNRPEWIHIPLAGFAGAAIASTCRSFVAGLGVDIAGSV
jgi:predicted trehalose synthase